MNDFVDHYLRPDRTPTPPTFDVGATVTRCLEPDTPMRYESAPTWHHLHPHHVTFTSDAGGQTSTAVAGPAALATDPISTATLPLPGSYPGCRIMRPSEPDPTAVTYDFDVAEELVLMGGTVVDIGVTSSGPDVPLSVRVWDVAADGSEQGLVTRGTYRMAEGPVEGRARFQLQPQGYRFPAGNRIKVEVVANDAPYHQASNIPAVVQVTDIEVVLPLLEAPGGANASPDEPASTDPDAPSSDEGDREPPALPATGGPGPALGLIALGCAGALGRTVRRGAPCQARSRRSRTPCSGPRPACW
jgi:hypothetical protein